MFSARCDGDAFEIRLDENRSLNVIKLKNPSYQKSGDEAQLFNPQRKILTRFVCLYILPM